MITFPLPRDRKETPEGKLLIAQAVYYSDLTGIITIPDSLKPHWVDESELERGEDLITGTDPLTTTSVIKVAEGIDEFSVFSNQWSKKPVINGRNYFHLVNFSLRGYARISLPYELTLDTPISETWVGLKTIKGKGKVWQIMESVGVVTYRDLLKIKPTDYHKNSSSLVKIGKTVNSETKNGKKFWETELTFLDKPGVFSTVTWGPQSSMLKEGLTVKLALTSLTGTMFWKWEYLSGDRPFEPVYAAREIGIEGDIFKSLVYDILLSSDPEFDVYKRIHFPTDPLDADKAIKELVNIARTEIKGEHTEFENKIIKKDHFEVEISSDYQSETASELAGRYIKSNHTLDVMMHDVGTGKTQIFLSSINSAVKAGAEIAIVSPTVLLSDQIKRDFIGMYGEVPENVRFGCKGLLDKPPVDYDILIIDEVGKHSPEQVFGPKARHLVVSSATPPNWVLAKASLHSDYVSHGSEIKRDKTIHALLYSMDDLPVQLINVPERTIIMLAAINVDPDGSWKDVIHLDRVKDFIVKHHPSLKYGVVHGSDSRDITKFNNGDVDVLICSNILESGINLSDARNIYILNAERFSLSSIMQAKGRLLREWENSQEGTCILFSDYMATDKRGHAFSGTREDVLDYYKDHSTWTIAKEMGSKLPRNHIYNTNV